MCRPKVPNDNNKKHLIFSFVSLLIPVFIDFPHVLFAQEVFGEIEEFRNSEMVILLGVSVHGQVGNELPRIVMEILTQSWVFSPHLK